MSVPAPPPTLPQDAAAHGEAASTAALVAGFEFEQTAFRGTSFYARAQLRALSELGFETLLLTSAHPGSHRLLERLLLARQLTEPQSPGKWDRRKLFLRDLLRPQPPRLVSLRHDAELSDQIDYLRWVDACLNRPSVYDFIRMRSLRGWAPYPLPSSHAEIVVTPAPIQIRAPRGVPLVTAFHDLAPLVRADHPPQDDSAEYLRRIQGMERYADAIICSSDAGRRELIAHFPGLTDRCTVIHPPASLFSEEIALAQDPTIERGVLRHYGVDPGGYLLYVGVIEHKKNVRRLVDAYLAVREQLGIPLLLVGWLGYRSEDVQRVLARKDTGIGHLGYVPQIDKAVLLRNARAMVFPSMYEGFGLPPLEAMQVGCPVLASNIPAVAEACGGAAYLVDCQSTQQLSQGLLRIALDEPLRSALTVRGYRRAEALSLERYRVQLGTVLSQFVTVPRMAEAKVHSAPTAHTAAARLLRGDTLVADIAPANEP